MHGHTLIFTSYAFLFIIIIIMKALKVLSVVKIHHALLLIVKRGAYPFCHSQAKDKMLIKHELE